MTHTITIGECRIPVCGGTPFRPETARYHKLNFAGFPVFRDDLNRQSTCEWHCTDDQIALLPEGLQRAIDYDNAQMMRLAK